MKSNQETILDNAIRALQSVEPGEQQLEASARSVAEQLGLYSAHRSALATSPIENCEDVQSALDAYRAGSLTNPRYLLIQAHLRECGACHRSYSAATSSKAVDWSTPRANPTFKWQPRKFAWALAPSLALFAIFFFVYRAFWQVPPGVRAEVKSIDGSAYRISGAGDRQLAVGDELLQGDQLRTSGGGHAVLRLADGSTVEVNERSVVEVGARGKNTTIDLDNGAVIVEAIHRTSGHLYVRTPDCRVAVTGTVFSVNSGIKGSRVAVLEGALYVKHAGADTLVHAGEQVTTNANLGTEPINQQIAWSHDRDKYLLLIAQFDVLQQRLQAIPAPDLRYSSDLLQRVPANSLLYVSIPNLGNFLSEANAIFNEQMQKSPVLQQWWNGGTDQKTEELNTLVDKLHQMSQYLGDEVVVIGIQERKSPGFAILADVKQGGLDSFLRSQSLMPASGPRLIVLNESSLAVTFSPEEDAGGYALVREHEVVFSNSIVTLKQVNAQLNEGSSGFATSDFGKRIASAYGRGAGMILAADLHQIGWRPSATEQAGKTDQSATDNTGVRDVRYLIAEHREKKGVPENYLNLEFAGSRRGIASWLAAPAPIGSLDFLTPNASIAVAVLLKDPAAIADDLMHMAVGEDSSPEDSWTKTEAKLHVDLRNDLAANLGGDFLLSLDGPVLPTPAWKAVIEVHDADRLEKTFETLVTTMQSESSAKSNGQPAHRIAIVPSTQGSQRFYAVHDLASGANVAEYTFADGYMILAQDRSVLLQAMHAHTSGDSLAHSTSFKELLPSDENANYSAVAYQNLSPVLTPLLANVGGDLADTVRQMAADARPTAICAWGKDSTIEAASNSRLLGFDLLALQALLHPEPGHAILWNNPTRVTVTN